MIDVSIHTRGGRKTVRGYKTCSPYFAITRTTKKDIEVGYKRFALTHKATGRVAFAGHVKPLRLLAGILGGLPIRWGRIRKSGAVLEPWRALPQEIQKWRVEFMRSL